MAVSSHVFPTLTLNGLKKTLDVSTETLDVLLIAPGTAYTWNSTSQAHVHVSDFLGGSGAGALTEVSTSGTGYSRQALTSVTLTTVSSLVTVLTCSNPTWTATGTIAATYALFYDNTGGADSARQVLGYWDFGSTQSVTGAPFVLTLNATGLFTWTHS